MTTFNGATASIVPNSFVGTYGNGTCTVSFSADGKLHLVSGNIDETVQLGGDENDHSDIFPGTNSVTATDYRAGGKQINIFLAKTGNVVSAEAVITQPTPKQTLANCQNMTQL